MAMQQACYLLLLLAVVCNAAPRVQDEMQGLAANKAQHRVRRNGQPSNYWWVPGSQGPPASVGHISCGDPGIPLYGSSLFESVQAGAIVVHSCNPGYRLVGAKLRLCQSNGQWTPDLPYCEYVDCGDPGIPIHGSKWVGSTSLGSIVKYMCDSGHQLLGSSFRVCQISGQWSGFLPRCESFGCPKLIAPKNGQVSVKFYSVSSTATYSCNNGFNLVGTPTRTCGQDEVWLGKQPICERIECDELEPPRNGRVTFKDTFFGSVAFYECDAGFQVVGEEIQTCQSNGQWSGRAPICSALECSNLPDIENGRAVVSSRAVGSIAHYICDSGFVLRGQESRTCQPSGDWSGEAADCIQTSCHKLINPPNGYVQVSGKTVGATATYSCVEGYVLDGERNRICQQNREWLGIEPYCRFVDCGELRAPQYGKVFFFGTAFGSVATYQCDSGFELVGVVSRTCRADGAWSDRAPVCRPRGCDELRDPPNGQVTLTGTAPGSFATYICNSGYQLQGTSSRVCQDSGEWSFEEPHCAKLGCGQLSDPENGQVKVMGTIAGSTAFYSCIRGFQLVGISTRVCQESGVWSGTEPFCTGIRCPDLKSPANGMVTLTGMGYGDLATYSCLSGFVLVGDISRTCQASGIWSGTEPECQAVECDHLVSPSNGQVIQSGRVLGSTATYICFPGFELEGSDTRICQESRQWSGSAPHCRPVNCGDLQDIANGHVLFLSAFFGSVANYSCQLGYSLLGNSARICQVNGQWSGEEPTCEVSDCGNLQPPTYGSVEMTGTRFWDTAVYSCDTGFMLVGETIRTCEANGLWNGVAPFCSPVECDVLEPPKDGKIMFISIDFGAMATYKCLPGFELLGDEVRRCQENGQWSGSEPFCQRIACDLLLPPKNGDVSFSAGLGFGSVATFMCNSPYSLVGNPTRVCLQDGRWSGSEPLCESVFCPPLESPQNGNVNNSDNIVGSTAVYSCDQGFSLVGSKSRVCQLNSFWTGVTPVCQPTDCDTLKPPDNGDVVLTGTTIGSRASYSCEEGFNLADGSEVRVCGENGQWRGDEPQCVGVICRSLPDPQNGRVEMEGFAFGDTTTYTCNPGFVLFGKGIRTCQENGEWNGKDPECRVVDCGQLTTPENGEVTYSGTSFGLTASYSCNAGFQLVGLATRVCQLNGEWSGGDPTCHPAACADLSDPDNGYVELTGSAYGDTATYFCDRGFQLTGPDTRICLDGGRWSGSLPTCAPINCDPPPSTENGHFILSNDLNIGSIATYSCNQGYFLSGTDSRTCQVDGTWSGSTPFCSSVDCGELPAPSNGFVIQSGTVFGSEAVYVCDPGFSSHGIEIRICQGDGTWSGEPLICLPEEEFDCGPLVDPVNGAVQVTGTTPNSLATYSCSGGFTFEGGNRQRRCIAGQGWSGSAPNCVSQECSQLLPTLNGRVLVMGTTVGSISVYQCDEGYILMGAMIRTCRVGGLWSGEEPRCEAVQCRRLPNPINGQVSATGVRLGSVATYICNEGFGVEGDGIRICQTDGAWSGTTPTCASTTPLDCGDPKLLENGRRFGDDFRIGASVYYECDENFILVGSDSRICQPDGNWTGNLPVCIESRVGECSGEGDSVVDSCSRQCVCRNGQTTDCCRLRLDFASMTVTERRRYINAVIKVASDSSFKPRYEALIAKYRSSKDTLAQETNPSISQFLPWHRYFLLEYENLLQEIDCRITIPYWDWTALPMNPYMAPIWNPDSGFGDSSRPSDGCVDNGPFSVDLFEITPSAGGGCLQRQYRLQQFPTRATVEQDLLTLLPEEFAHFHQFLHLFLHTNVRCFVGGQMCSSDAANDPAYILHLAHLDFLFTRWQGIDRAHHNAAFFNDTRRLVLTDDEFEVLQFSDNQDLPNTVRVCYGHNHFKNHIPPSMTFLTSALEEMTDNPNLHMECISEQAVDGVAMSVEDREFMHRMCSHGQGPGPH